MPHPRYREYVPPLRKADARRLRRLPVSWERRAPESDIEAVKRRALVCSAILRASGHAFEADELSRALETLTRADDLHRHASTLETLAGLYRALALLALEEDPAADTSVVWAQTGALTDGAPGVHGPAYRETAALRNRALRWVTRLLSKPPHVAATEPHVNREDTP